MPTPDEPGTQPAITDPEAESSETVSLVDLFDQIDRRAFRRALEHRDNNSSNHSDS